MNDQSLLELCERLYVNVWFRGLIILLAYSLAAKIADFFIDRILRRIVSKTRMTFDDQLIAFVHAPFCWSVFWVGVLHSLIVLPLLPPWAIVLPGAAKTVILLIWSVALLRFFNQIVDKQGQNILERGKIGTDLFLLLKNLARVLLVVAAFFWFLAIWNIDMTPLFASAGIAGIAVALAAKDTLANFFGGLSIFMDKTFKVGDYIVLDTQERGEVVEIGIRSTRIKTRDDILITIPNAILANSKIINESAPLPRFRIRIPVGVAYGSDLDFVENVLLEIASANPRVSRDPEPRVRLRRLAESSVDFELLCWVDDPGLKGLETHNLLRDVHQMFMKKGITIPFPQRDVNLKQTF